MITISKHVRLESIYFQTSSQYFTLEVDFLHLNKWLLFIFANISEIDLNENISETNRKNPKHLKQGSIWAKRLKIYWRYVALFVIETSAQTKLNVLFNYDISRTESKSTILLLTLIFHSISRINERNYEKYHAFWNVQNSNRKYLKYISTNTFQIKKFSESEIQMIKNGFYIICFTYFLKKKLSKQWFGSKILYLLF